MLAQRLSYWVSIAEKETIIVVRHGKPVVKIVPYKEDDNGAGPRSLNDLTDAVYTARSAMPL